MKLSLPRVPPIHHKAENQQQNYDDHGEKEKSNPITQKNEKTLTLEIFSSDP